MFGLCKASTAFLLGAGTILPLLGQTFTSLVSFDRTNGANPQYSPLVQGKDGNFYGTTVGGGNQNGGTVFKITPTGTLSTLNNFGGSNNAGGSDVYAGLVQGADGNFYGTTLTAETAGIGTIYKITPAGVLTTIFTFGANDGTLPYNSLVQASDGNFYGTTYEGGANGDGTVFQVTPGGSFTNLHSFNFTDGERPHGALIQAADGNLYGTTSLGGAHGNGTVFSITTAGKITTLYSFGGTADGAEPFGALIQASDGNLYGTTRLGGTSRGTIYKMTTAGKLTTLYSFTNGADGGSPTGGVVQASDGNFYGTTESGGANNDGTIFKMTSGGTLTTLHTFNGTDGRNPEAGLVQGADGNLYGTTTNGGKNNVGTVFSLALSSTSSTAPAISASGIVNGASFVGGGVVPGELATVFGSDLTSAMGINPTSGLPLPSQFLKSSVIVNNQPAPLFAVDNLNGQQINFQVPWEVASGENATLAVENNGVSSATVSLPVLAAQPGIFNYSSGGKTFGAILHADFQLADSGHPAKPEETVLIYCTGLGAVLSPPEDGSPGNGQLTKTTPTVTIGGASSMVTFSGLAPGFVGLYQVNVEVPAGLSAGDQAVVIKLAGISSNSVLLPVQ